MADDNDRIPGIVRWFDGEEGWVSSMPPRCRAAASYFSPTSSASVTEYSMMARRLSLHSRSRDSSRTGMTSATTGLVELVPPIPSNELRHVHSVDI